MQLIDPEILIADDDVDFRSALSEAFERRGFRTTLASDGQEALELVRVKTTLHVALLDVHMPRLTGLEALEEIRRLELPSLPCLFMTAQLDEHIQRRAQALAGSQVLSKPFSLQTVTAAVRELLQRTYGYAI